MKEMKDDNENPKGVDNISARMSCGIGVLALALKTELRPLWNPDGVKGTAGLCRIGTIVCIGISLSGMPIK